MKRYFLLLLLAGPAAAQTTPAQPNSANWYIFDQPIPADPNAKRPEVAPDTPAPAVAPAPEAPAVAAPVPVATPAPVVAVPPAPAPVRPLRRARRASYQGTLYVPLDVNTYRLLDRYAIKYGPDSAQDPHTSARPYSRAAAAHLGERLLVPTVAGQQSAADRFNAEYLLKDNWMFSPTGDSINQSQRPIFKYFYRDQTDLYSVQTPDFALRVNPVLLLQGGHDSGDNSIDGLRYVNTRGAAFEGLIDQRLGFYGFFADNQEAVPGWVQQRVVRDTIVPHEGYWKPFKTSGSAYDFFTARGGITYAATRHINLQLAHDRNFIGNGYRSLILSDYSTPYFFLKINTRVWKFNYQNLFAELTAEKKNADQVYPKKYLALHHLSLDVTDDFNIGLFESEVAGGPERGLEIQYLNPVIFYRAIEQQVGSADNALLGLDFKWNIKHRGQLYGQVVLDEFKLKEVLAGNGWWANKQAVQLGGKLLDVAGIRNLDLQVEFNYIRPYTYQHESYYTNYQHYQQPLAHPMGANLSEVLAVLSYQPLPRLNLVAKGFYTKQGLDVTDASGHVVNYGGNPLLPYNVPPRPAGMDYGNRVGQGNRVNLLHLDFTATYQPRLNLFLDATLIARSNRNDNAVTSSGYVENYASLALRWNIAQRLHEF